MAATGIVPSESMRWPILKALKELGGSSSVDELEAKVAQELGLSEKVQGLLHRDGPRTEFSYRLAWARTFLKGARAVQNSERGIWSLTPYGAGLTEADMGQVAAKVRAAGPTGGKAGHGKRKQGQAEPDGPDPDSWQDTLLAELKRLPPDRFEILSQRLLRESGFDNVVVTGKTGDGGIDGHGTLQMNLVSFRVAFQCKRWKGSVGAPVVRDFRGAMVGRAEKGVIITTGHFTPEAFKEARREGAWVIDLIDGGGLCELLKRFGWGVSSRPVEHITVDASWFASNLAL